MAGDPHPLPLLIACTGYPGRLTTVMYLYLRQNVRDMALDCSRAQVELVPDLAVRIVINKEG
jgi:hypothetical protein